MNEALVDRRGILAIAGMGGIAAIAWNASAPASASRRFEITRADSDWRRLLGPQRFAVLRQAATERAGTSALLEEHRRGAFVCAGCSLPLFSSTTKFDSGTGWPSFFRPLPKAVVTEEDRSLLMRRIEVLCRRCGGHLGHVFDDGPKPTGLRYCMNGVAMAFKPLAA